MVDYIPPLPPLFPIQFPLVYAKISVIKFKNKNQIKDKCESKHSSITELTPTD